MLPAQAWSSIPVASTAWRGLRCVFIQLIPSCHRILPPWQHFKQGNKPQWAGCLFWNIRVSKPGREVGSGNVCLETRSFSEVGNIAYSSHCRSGLHSRYPGERLFVWHLYKQTLHWGRHEISKMIWIYILFFSCCPKINGEASRRKKTFFFRWVLPSNVERKWLF